MGCHVVECKGPLRVGFIADSAVTSLVKQVLNGVQAAEVTVTHPRSLGSTAVLLTPLFLSLYVSFNPFTANARFSIVQDEVASILPHVQAIVYS